MASRIAPEVIETGFRRRLVAACLITAALVHPALARATFNSATDSVSTTIGTGALSAPSGLVALNGVCVPSVSITTTLTWVASPSGFLDGYQVLRSTTPGSGYDVIATLGPATLAYVDTGVTFSTTYYYVVRATKNSWRSGNSGESSIATLDALCL